jgi:hypothetical protein
MCFYDSQLVRVSGGTPTGPQVSVPSPPLSLSTAESLSGPLRRSLPALPVSVSMPLPPVMVSLPTPPVMVSLPSPPLMVSSNLVPVMVSLPPLPLIVLPGSALVQSIVSFAAVPVTVVSVWVTPGPTTQLVAAEAEVALISPLMPIMLAIRSGYTVRFLINFPMFVLELHDNTSALRRDAPLDGCAALAPEV